MSKWEKLVEHGGRVATYAEAGLEWAYGYYARMDRTRAYIVTMCKCLCAYVSLPQITELSIIRSAAPCCKDDMDQNSLGARLHLRC